MGVRRSDIRRRARATGIQVVAVILLTGAVALVVPGTAAASTTETPDGTAAALCDRWASVNGDDVAPGTYAQPRRTLRGLVPLLAPGETGCVKAGETLDLSGGWGVVNAGGGTVGSPVTIRSEPGGPRARMQGLVHIQAPIHDVVLEDLTLIGPTSGPVKNVMVLIDGDRIAIRDSDLSYPRGICMQIGNVNNGSRADDLLLEGNRIHDCGMSPYLSWSNADSGAHGIYVQHALDAVITQNEIYDNRFRGIQTWPGPVGTTISHNVLDGNGSNINLGHDLPTYVSQGTEVVDNIITNATLYFDLSKNPANVHGTIPTDTYGNVVSGNCVYHVDPTKNFSGTGYTQTGNTIADPQFVDRGAKDFRPQPGSPCSGKGPTRSVAAPAVTAVMPAVGVTSGGTTVSLTGHGFTGATAVRFGSTPATSFAVVDDDTITAVAPARAAGLVNVWVDGPGGTSTNAAPSWYRYLVSSTVAPTVTSLTPNIGPVEGGTAVTLRGTGFVDATSVRFGPVAEAAFVVVNDTTITAVAPALPVSLVNVWVSNSAGSSVNTQASWYRANVITGPPPTVTSVSPATGSVGGGVTVTLTGTGFSDAASVRFGSTTAPSFTVVSSTTITVVVPARPAGLVNVWVATQNGSNTNGSSSWYRYG